MRCIHTSFIQLWSLFTSNAPWLHSRHPEARPPRLPGRLAFAGPKLQEHRSKLLSKLPLVRLSSEQGQKVNQKKLDVDPGTCSYAEDSLVLFGGFDMF